MALSKDDNTKFARDEVTDYMYPLEDDKHKSHIQFILYKYAKGINNDMIIDKIQRVQIYTPQAIQISDSHSYDTLELTVLDEQKELVQEIMNGNSSGAAAAGLSTIKSSLAKQILSSSENVRAINTLVTNKTLNPNIGALFRSPNLRSFSFTFNFVPSSDRESITVKEIVKFFRKNSYPTLANNDSFMYVVPNTFKIKQVYNGGENENLIKIAQCACTATSVVYNPNNSAWHSDGSPTEIQLTLTFQEIRTLHSADIEKGF